MFTRRTRQCPIELLRNDNVISTEAIRSSACDGDVQYTGIEVDNTARCYNSVKN